MLKKKIQIDVREALKARDEKKRIVLGSLLAVIQNKEIEKRGFAVKKNLSSSQEELAKASELSDDDVIQVIQGEVKKRKESIELYRKGLREDLAKKEESELELFGIYLPEQISEEELRGIVKKSIQELQAKEAKDMGKVIADVVAKVKGQAQGSYVSRIVKKELIQ